MHSDFVCDAMRDLLQTALSRDSNGVPRSTMLNVLSRARDDNRCVSVVGKSEKMRGNVILYPYIIYILFMLIQFAPLFLCSRNCANIRYLRAEGKSISNFIIYVM